MNLASLLRFASAAFIATACLLGARAEDAVSRVKFSDPSKPGTLRIMLARGDVVVDGTNTPDVVVKSENQPTRPSTKDGLRVLTDTSSFSLVEKDNVVTLDATSDGWMASPSDFRVSVPAGTNVVISSSMGGDVSCNGVSGDIEVKSMQGGVRLNDVAGGVLVETMSGDLNATFRELRDGKAVSFTSMNGKVEIRLPATAKANLRLRTQNGSIATDFDEKALVTKVESVSPGMRKKTSGALSAEAREAFRQAARAGAEAARHAAEAVREAAEAAREGADTDAGADRSAHVSAPRPPMPPPIPTVTGGKLVTGTLNGGGAEINVATMNGDITIRRASGGAQ